MGIEEGEGQKVVEGSHLWNFGGDLWTPKDAVTTLVREFHLRHHEVKSAP